MSGDSACLRCGGSIVGQDVFQGSHRYFPDCVSYLKSVRDVDVKGVAADIVDLLGAHDLDIAAEVVSERYGIKPE